MKFRLLIVTCGMLFMTCHGMQQNNKSDQELHALEKAKLDIAELQFLLEYSRQYPASEDSTLIHSLLAIRSKTLLRSKIRDLSHEEIKQFNALNTSPEILTIEELAKEKPF